MMLSYLNIYKHPVSKIITKDYLDTLYYPGWGDPIKNIHYSAMNVIDSPRKYADEFTRIKKAKLSHPIIISSDGNIVDGVHRLSKAFLQNKRTLNAYVFDKVLMKKFIIGRHGEWDKIEKMPYYRLISLFFERFCR